MPLPSCRWGIIGTANIARKNWKAIRNSGNSTLVAVASRDRERAELFIRECQASAPMPTAPVPCASYAELLERQDVDAVYVPLPTTIRKEWVIKAAEAGKHVLCEKPCAVTSVDLRDMLDACQKKRLQFMDGVMFMHSQRLPILRQVVDASESVGKLLRITSQFSFKAPEEFLNRNIRARNDLEPLGCLGDLGWYNIRFSLWAMNEQLPKRVSGRMLAEHCSRGGGQGVPMEFSAELFFAEGATASFYCSFRTVNQQWAVLSGTEGYLHVPDFVLPFYGSESSFTATTPVFHVDGCDFNMEEHTRRFAVSEYSSGMANSQETNMIRKFAAIVTAGRIEPDWGERALKTQQVLDACLRSALADGKLTPVLAKSAVG